jgi:TRAP-type C4-dicarboxylate transport system substrate-binding protein
LVERLDQKAKRKGGYGMRHRFLYLVLLLLVPPLLVAGTVGKASAEKTITLKFACWSPSGGKGFGDNVHWFLDEIEKRTKGQVKFERYFGGTLIPAKEEVGALGKGVADLASVQGAFQKRLSLIDVVELPGLGSRKLPILEKMNQQARVMREISKMKGVADQFDKNNLIFLAVQGGDPQSLISTTPFRTIDDLKGKKIRCLGKPASVLKSLGAVPVALTSSECYESLERGIVEGVVMAVPGITIWKLEEISKYINHLDIFRAGFYFMMNKDSWNGLPENIKHTFLDVAGYESEAFTCFRHVNGWVPAEQKFREAGLEETEFSEADQAKIVEAAKPVWEDWVKKEEKKGLPAREVLNRCLELNGMK